MRVVFDTNIYVSALALPGGRAESALQRAIREEHRVLISHSILDELLGVLARKFARDAEELSRVALFLDDLCESVAPAERVEELADDRILECALAGRAEAIVTGDGGVLRLGELRGVRIVSLAQYLDERRPRA